MYQTLYWRQQREENVLLALSQMSSPYLKLVVRETMNLFEQGSPGGLPGEGDILAARSEVW